MDSDETKSYINYALDNIDWFYSELNKGNLGKNWEINKIKLDDTRQLLLTILIKNDSNSYNEVMSSINWHIKVYKEERRLCNTEEEMSTYDTVLGVLYSIKNKENYEEK